MAKTGIHIKRCNVSSVEDHNERKKNYLRKLQELGRRLYFFQDLTRLNKSWVNPNYAGKTVAQHFDEMCARYQEKTGQAPQLKDRERIDKKTGKVKVIAGWSPIREGCPPIKPDTTLRDFAPFVQWLRNKNLNVIRIDLHHDEGHENETGQRIMNHHAHVVIDWTDHHTGKTVKLSKKDMEEMQSVLADSLGMERGTPKADTGREHVDHAEWREQKAEEHYNQLMARCDELQNLIEKQEEEWENGKNAAIERGKKIQEIIDKYNAVINDLKKETARQEEILRETKAEVAANAKKAVKARKAAEDAQEHLEALKGTQKAIQAATEAVKGFRSKFFGSDTKRFDALQEELYQAKKDAREWETVARYMQHTEGQGDQIQRQQERISELEGYLDKAAPGWRAAERTKRAQNTLHLDFSNVPRSETRQQTNSRTRSNDQEQGRGRGRK